jgi:hypothetical protein
MMIVSTRARDRAVLKFADYNDVPARIALLRHPRRGLPIGAVGFRHHLPRGPLAVGANIFARRAIRDERRIA